MQVVSYEKQELQVGSYIYRMTALAATSQSAMHTSKSVSFMH